MEEQIASLLVPASYLVGCKSAVSARSWSAWGYHSWRVGNKNSLYTEQDRYGGVPVWFTHCLCRYRHHTFMCHKYITSNINLNNATYSFWRVNRKGTPTRHQPVWCLHKPHRRTLSRRVWFWLSFVCFFVVVKPENPYFASRPGLEVKPLGVCPLGPPRRSSSCGPTKGTPPPRNTFCFFWVVCRHTDSSLFTSGTHTGGVQ